eukprot:TRINITY_DN61433_c0_g1_i1.p1 TRINITY_DN61433_c0_g1~~TRINITY_DN61433_c0_g1_i1.p1  ORF type:complete len:728 (+),score=135.18 TRINITY_DN61433_c0_g1_i1:51-2234(+)
MGVPMLRPDAEPDSAGSAHGHACSASGGPPGGLGAWLDIFSFCDVRDLGMCLAVDKQWWAVVDSPHIWAYAYDRTQRVDASSAPNGEGVLRSLIERPFGEDAVGWHVAVLIEDGSENYSTGHIIAYSIETDTYLVSYDTDGTLPGDSPRMAWEQERRKRTAAMRHNPSLAGKSRFSFLAPPPPLPCTGISSASCAEHEEAWKSRTPHVKLLREPLRGSWKQELQHNVRNAPARMLTRLSEHTDEVLFVVFSPCGTRLASCSRDLRTVVFKVLHRGDHGAESSEASCTQRHHSTDFELEAEFTHQTAPCRAIWWPIPPYNTLAVSTEDAGWQTSKIELWQIGPRPDEGDLQRQASVDSDEVAVESEEQLPSGQNAHCIFQCHNRPFDIYAAIFPWPPVRASLEDVDHTMEEDPLAKLCFLAGWAVLRENEHYVQWLNVWPGPRHPNFKDASKGSVGGPNANGPRPLARLRLEGDMNYLHCLEVGPEDNQGQQRILAMTGNTPHLCNEIGLIDLSSLQRRGEGAEGLAAGGLQGGETANSLPAVYDASVQVHSLGERVVLSAKWNSAGNFILLNTRPYARTSNASSSGTHSRSPEVLPQRDAATFEDLLMRPAPDLSTKMELLLLDAGTLNIVGLFDGHFAFTTKESPFLIFTDEWANTDFLASGGEDHRVYVWHRRHGRLLQRLCGHTEPVNAVSWNGSGLLASASDDHSIIVWAAGSSNDAGNDIAS